MRYFLLVLLLTMSAAAQELPKVFRDLPWVTPPLGDSEAGRVKRLRAVEPDYTLFDVEAASRFVAQSARPPRLLQLNLFDDVQLTLQLRRVEHVAIPEDTLVWTGDLPGRERSEAIIAVSGKVHTGVIRTGDGSVYLLRNASGLVHWIEEADPALLPIEAQPKVASDSELPPAPAFDLPAADDGSLTDVLVVYTPSARQGAGGVAQINGMISAAIAETNQGYANSGVIQRLRLVGASEVSYSETGSGTTDLDRLTSTSDGFLDSVHALRNASGADVVSLWVESSDVCGIGWIFRSNVSDFASKAFNVVKRYCGFSYMTLGHEIGHNLGAAHDEANSNSAGFFPYSYGYQQKTSLPYWATVMAYPCSGGINCPRINYYSNPDGRYNNVATGAANTNNARTFNETRNFASNWRPAVTGLTIAPLSAAYGSAPSSGFISVTAASGVTWTAISGTGWITITAGSQGTGNGTVSYAIAANTSPAPRSGSITIGGVFFTISQGGTANTCSTTTITIPQSITSSLSPADCPSPIRQNVYAKRFTFSASAGQQISVQLSSSSFDSYLTLIAPNGLTLIEDDDSGGGLNARIPPVGLYTLPSSGIYTIEATAFANFATGPFTLVVSAPTNCTYQVSPGNITLNAGLNNSAINVITSSGCTWTASSNAPWISIGSSGVTTGSGTALYSVAANSGAAGRSGTITVAGQTVTINQGGLSGACAAGTIAPDQTVSGSFTGACTSFYRGAQYYANRYTFSGSAGQRISIALDSPTLDTYLYLSGPTGAVLAEDDDSGGNLNSLIPPTGFFTLPQTGSYTIEATTFDILDTGFFTLRLTSSTPTTMTVNGPFRFVTLPPCRIADTRAGNGFTGSFGPPTLAAGTSRTIQVRASACGIPVDARVYSLNFTVVPVGPLGYLSTWPSDQAQPLVSTLNSPRGNIVANAAIVPAAADGSISVYVSNTTDVIIDINGYFAP